MVKKIMTFFSRLKNLIFFDLHEKKFIRRNLLETKNRKFNDQTIIFQCINDYFYVLLYSIVIKELKDNNAKRIGIINVPLVIRKHHYFIIFPILVKYLLYKLEIRKLKKIYRAIGVDGFVFHNQFDLFLNIKVLIRAAFLFLNLKTKKQLQNLTYEGVKLGDLIMDTYLRYYVFNVTPTIKLKSFWLFKVIYDAISIFNFHTKLNNKNNVNRAFFSMSVYIYHGIPARVYESSGIDVFVAGGFTKLYKKLDSSFYYSMQKDHSNFKIDFEQKFSDKERLLGEKKFSERFNGIDDTGYIKNLEEIGGLNTYDKFRNKDLNLKLDGVLFLHDFYDAHKTYNETIFSDFYEWAVFTLEIIKKYNLKIGIKPHPHSLIIFSSIVVDKLKKKYSDLIWIDKNTSNISIFRSGIKFGISHSGSVLSELAYHSITPICCYENSASSFDFTYQANSIEEYQQLLLKANDLPMKNRLEVGCYYYMNHIDGESDYEVVSSKVNGINIAGVNRFNVKSLDLNSLDEI
jgi:hypothetical protein